MLALALAAIAPLAAAAATAPTEPHLLFVDHQEIVEIDPRLKLRMQPPVKGERVLTPTEPWESWAVFAYNSAVFNYTLAVSPSCTYISCSATAGSSSDNVTIDQHEAPGGTNTVRADFLFSRRIPVPPRENSSVCPWSRSPDAHRRPS